MEALCGKDKKIDLSIVVPVYNEQNNVGILYNQIKYIMGAFNPYFKLVNKDHLINTYNSYEIIFVDDGSSDSTFDRLVSINDPKLKVIRFRKNFGQSAAFLAGFNNAKGRVIATLDGDLQNNPADIPRLLAKLDDGYDCVSGWRFKRRDRLSVHIMSRVSNYLRHKLIHDQINDSGCSLKVYKAECLKDIELYGEMHRYICSLVKLKGFKIGELKVTHRPRLYGKTKYNFSKVLKGFIDLLNVWFWQKFSNRPLHFFGVGGMFSIMMGFMLGLYSLYLKVAKNIDMSENFLSVVSIFLVMVGLQLFFSGILGDIMIKTYNRTKGRRSYEVKEVFEGG